MDTDEFQQKCHLLRMENKKLRLEIHKYTSKALRLGQIVHHKRCELCLSFVAAHKMHEHLCAGLAGIKCDYCADTNFPSTTALAEHLFSGVHTNMKLYKCSKCNLGFRMNALLKIHENFNHAYLSRATTNACKYTSE